MISPKQILQQTRSKAIALRLVLLAVAVICWLTSARAFADTGAEEPHNSEGAAARRDDLSSSGPTRPRQEILPSHVRAGAERRARVREGRSSRSPRSGRASCGGGLPPHSDAQGTTTHLTRASASDFAYGLDTWGRPRTSSDPTGNFNRLLYAGTEYDTAVGLHHAQGQFIDPDTGRLLSGQGLVAYKFAGDNPERARAQRQSPYTFESGSFEGWEPLRAVTKQAICALPTGDQVECPMDRLAVAELPGLMAFGDDYIGSGVAREVDLSTTRAERSAAYLHGSASVVQNAFRDFFGGLSSGLLGLASTHEVVGGQLVRNDDRGLLWRAMRALGGGSGAAARGFDTISFAQSSNPVLANIYAEGEFGAGLALDLATGAGVGRGLARGLASGVGAASRSRVAAYAGGFARGLGAHAAVAWQGAQSVPRILRGAREAFPMHYAQVGAEMRGMALGTVPGGKTAARVVEAGRRSVASGIRPVQITPVSHQLPATALYGSRLDVIREVNAVLAKHLDEIRAIAPDARVGYRGSLARGFKGSHKSNAPFDASRFDVDAFIVSDSLRTFRPPGGFPMSKSVRHLEKQIHRELKSLFPGLKGGKDKFSFRVFRSDEVGRKFGGGGVQIFIE